MLPLDLSLFQALNAGPETPAMVLWLARAASQGEAIGMLVLLAISVKRPAHSSGHALLLGLTAVLTTWCLVRGLRMWVPFPRPAELGLGIQWAVQGHRPGFPSMHTATAFAMAGALFCAGQRPVAWVGLSYAALIAWSRLCLGLHFPSDVLAGALTGLGCTAIAVRFLPLQLRWLGKFSAYWFRLAPPWVRHK